MSKPFPTVGIIGAGHLSRMCVAPATQLGINLLLLDSEIKDLQSIREFASKCDVITYESESIAISTIKSLEAEGVVIRPSWQLFENLQVKVLEDFDDQISVMVARSPHGQATTWAPTKSITTPGTYGVTITPAPAISAALSEAAQKMGLEIAAHIGLIGVMHVELYVVGQALHVKNVNIGLHDSGVWSIEGSITSQFEQYVRAILDLPLGDPSMTSQCVVTGKVVLGDKPDMYRPYLHLMARTPGLKFHQYKNGINPGQQVGHVTLIGHNYVQLQSEIEHALDYFSGVIDE